ncbi:MAG: NUDIX domain-containing protein [bacterium]|nr:NUDIX domain-containing protein [bacterium]
MASLVKGTDYTGVSIVYFCHDGQGSFVMAKRGPQARDEQERWDIGGGGLEFGDDVEATLKKEIMEEYCAEARDFEFLGFRDVHREHEGRQTHWIALDFKVLVDRDQVRNGEPHKFEAVTWFTLARLPERLHSQLPRFFEKYHQQLSS